MERTNKNVRSERTRTNVLNVRGQGGPNLRYNYGFITNYSLNNFRVVRENYNLIKNNTIEISQKTAKALQISTGDKVRINIENI